MSSLRPGARDTIIGVRLRTLPPHLDATRRFPVRLCRVRSHIDHPV